MAARAIGAALATGLPAAAWAAAPGDPAAWPLAAAVGGGALVVALLAVRGAVAARGRRRALDALLAREALLETAPGAWCLWRPGGPAEPSRSLPALVGLTAPPAHARDIANAFDAAAASALAEALARLEADGEPFEQVLTTAHGRSLALEGRRLDPGGACALWLRDVSAAASAQAMAGQARRELALLRGALDALPFPVWRRDLAGSVAWRNRAAELAAATGGGAATEGAGAALAGRALRTRQAQSESRYSVQDGARRLLEVTEAPLADESGTVGHVQDVTAIEETQADLARHIAAHGEVLEKLATAIAIFGPDRRLAFHNSAFDRLWGSNGRPRERHPTIGEWLDELRERRRLPEQSDFRAFRREFERLFTSLIEPREELLFLPDDTTLRMVVAPHPFGGLVFTFEDVTDRMALERSYNTLIEVQRETLDQLYEGVVVFGGDGRMRLSNPRFGQLWSLSEAELAERPHVSRVLERFREQFAGEAEWQAFAEQVTRRLATREEGAGRLERRDGSIIDYAFVPLPDGATLTIYRDVSDTLRVQRALQERNEALETADRLKSEFIANVSYELRTPLNAIIGFSEILEKQYFGPLNERQLDYARSILASSERLVSLVNDILDLSTIEAGYLELELADTDVPALVDAVEALVRERARAQQLELVVERGADLGQAEVDERRIKQALVNLVSNAVKFTPPGGLVRLAVDRAATEAGDELVFTVADTGMGASTEQPRVFERLRRGGRGRAPGGAGLGLALVKSLIELHHGTVAMEAHRDAGTTVTCRIPARQPKPPAPREAESD